MYWYEIDLDDACDEVDWFIDRYGYILYGEIRDIAYYYDVLVSDIYWEFGWD